LLDEKAINSKDEVMKMKEHVCTTIIARMFEENYCTI